MANVKVYTTNYCPFCDAAKNLLSHKKVEFEEINLSDSPQKLAELKERTGLRTVPQIFINEDLIGGFDDMNALNQNGQLDELLAK